MNRPRGHRTILIGGAGSGKSTLVDRLAGNDFDRLIPPTTGVDFRVVEKGLAPVPIRIWDTAGAERFQAVMTVYYRNVDFCLLVFDASRRNWDAQVRFWTAELRKHSPDCRIFLIGNKIDQGSVVPMEQAVRTAREMGAVGVAFVSAKHMGTEELRGLISPLFETIHPASPLPEIRQPLLGSAMRATKPSCCHIV